MVFWICKSIIICIPVSRINYLFHFLSGTKCLNHLFSQSSGRSFLYEPKTVDNSHSEQTLVLLTAVLLLWMMMEDGRCENLTFHLFYTALNSEHCHTIAICTAILVIHFFLTLFSRKLVAWLDITHVEFQAYHQKIFNSIVSQNIS